MTKADIINDIAEKTGIEQNANIQENQSINPLNVPFFPPLPSPSSSPLRSRLLLSPSLLYPLLPSALLFSPLLSSPRGVALRG